MVQRDKDRIWNWCLPRGDMTSFVALRRKVFICFFFFNLAGSPGGSRL